jgi:uncharacterized protein (DUF169 family)
VETQDKDLCVSAALRLCVEIASFFNTVMKRETYGCGAEGGDLRPVGVRVLRSAGEWSDVPVYRGVSYCDAVRRAGEGEALRVLPGSLQVCRWAPVVLGLKEPVSRFERKLLPRLPFPTAGLLLAPLDRRPVDPEVVIVRAERDVLVRMVESVGRERLWDGHRGRLDRSALPLFTGGRAEGHGMRSFQQGLIGAVNRLLAALARSARWQAFTHWLFRSGVVTAGFDALISRTMADMSICRNATVIPLLTGRANVSFFCTGGVTWGRNRADHCTAGWPWVDFLSRGWHTPGEPDPGWRTPREHTCAVRDSQPAGDVDDRG